MILRARARLRRIAHDDARMRNHELSQLMGFAFHEPKKLPKFKPTETQVQKQAKAQEHVRAFFIGLAMKGKI
ncbi:MAG: hypothetical protein AAF801_09865 [Pseudomonadota bacterium]